KLGKDSAGAGTSVLAGVSLPDGTEDCFLAGEAFALGAYRFGWEELKHWTSGDEFGKRDKLNTVPELKETGLTGTGEQKKAFKEGFEFGRYIDYARTLGNLPANYLGVDEMIAYIRKTFENLPVEVKVLRDKELKDISAGGILSVNSGSEKEAGVVILKYCTSSNKHLKALVGKGVMFDTGGHHLKDMSSMFGMKYDMCGAATVLELVEYLAVQKKEANIVAVLPLVENSIGPKASRPGDVVNTVSGLSVEVLNTDAEGRLILCDAIGIAAKEGARTIIDLATLTYSAREALGDKVAGIFANTDDEFGRFNKAATASGESVWRLPLGKPYCEWVRNTKFADLINYGPGKGAGASFAASFLEAFVPEGVKWLHIDYVGPSVTNDETDELTEGATGAMAGSLYRYLEESDK
ncbi:MAG: leucyl aminopeptidase family protein, partial [Lachnospiraceae bacterium]|nr:leucyl aminopeptidase family protein [Lachnospiraceae bacterium]